MGGAWAKLVLHKSYLIFRGSRFTHSARVVAVTMMRIIFVLIVGASLLGLCLGQEVCTAEEYNAGLAKIGCTQKDVQALIDVFTECGRDDLAEEMVNNCRTTKNVTCALLARLISFRNPIEIRRCYTDDTFGERILSCTAECKEDLEVYVNDTLGCCSRNVFEHELLAEYPPIVLVRELIDMCDLSGLRQGPCTTNSTLSFTPSGATEPSCNRNELFGKLAEIPCTPAYLEPRLAFSESCGFSTNEETPLACEKGDDGVICISHPLTVVDEVELNCIQGANDCPEACRTAIESLRKDLGCCVNNLFNQSVLPIYATSYELWSMCGVETVGVCGRARDSGQAPAADITKLLFAIAFLVLALIVL